MHYSKTAWCIQTIYNQMTALLSDICHFWVRAECRLRLASYGSKHIWQSLSYPHFVRTYTHNLKTTGHIQCVQCKDILPTKQLLYYQRCLFSVLKLHARCFVSFGSSMHRGFFLIWHFVCTYIHKSKITGCIRTFYISNNYSIIGDGYFWVRASCELWLQTHITVSFWYAVCVYFHA